MMDDSACVVDECEHATYKNTDPHSINIYLQKK